MRIRRQPPLSPTPGTSGGSIYTDPSVPATSGGMQGLLSALRYEDQMGLSREKEERQAAAARAFAETRESRLNLDEQKLGALNKYRTGQYDQKQFELALRAIDSQQRYGSGAAETELPTGFLDVAAKTLKDTGAKIGITTTGTAPAPMTAAKKAEEAGKRQAAGKLTPEKTYGTPQFWGKLSKDSEAHSLQFGKAEGGGLNVAKKAKWTAQRNYEANVAKSSAPEGSAIKKVIDKLELHLASVRNDPTKAKGLERALLNKPGYAALLKNKGLALSDDELEVVLGYGLAQLSKYGHHNPTLSLSGN